MSDDDTKTRRRKRTSQKPYGKEPSEKCEYIDENKLTSPGIKDTRNGGNCNGKAYPPAIVHAPPVTKKKKQTLNYINRPNPVPTSSLLTDKVVRNAKKPIAVSKEKNNLQNNFESYKNRKLTNGPIKTRNRRNEMHDLTETQKVLPVSSVFNTDSNIPQTPQKSSNLAQKNLSNNKSNLKPSPKSSSEKSTVSPKIACSPTKPVQKLSRPCPTVKNCAATSNNELDSSPILWDRTSNKRSLSNNSDDFISPNKSKKVKKKNLRNSDDEDEYIPTNCKKINKVLQRMQTVKELATKPSIVVEDVPPPVKLKRPLWYYLRRANITQEVKVSDYFLFRDGHMLCYRIFSEDFY